MYIGQRILKEATAIVEGDILKKTGILVCVPLPTFRDPTSQSRMPVLEISPHPTCEVKGNGDCECLHTTYHMASEKWEVGLKREFLYLKYPTQVGVRPAPEVRGRLHSAQRPHSGRLEDQ